MKKLVAILIALNCVCANANDRYAHEYSSDDYNEREERYEQKEWHENNAQPRYQQNRQQSPIQIYLSPKLNSYSLGNNSYQQRHPHHHREERYREDQRWRDRREELEWQPQTPYYENQFNRDDTHW